MVSLFHTRCTQCIFEGVNNLDTMCTVCSWGYFQSVHNAFLRVCTNHARCTQFVNPYTVKTVYLRHVCTILIVCRTDLGDITNPYILYVVYFWGCKSVYKHTVYLGGYIQSVHNVLRRIWTIHTLYEQCILGSVYNPYTVYTVYLEGCEHLHTV